MDIDAAQSEIGFGPYQIRNLVLILLSTMLCGTYSVTYVFAAGDLQYRCKIPECESDPPTYTPTRSNWTKWALPAGGVARCSKYKRADDTTNSCAAEHFTNETQSCDDWVYETNETIVAEFNLACADWKRAMVGSAHNVGYFVALSFTGLLSDRFGRKPIFIGMSSIKALTGLTRALSSTYIMYLMLELADAILGAGSYIVGFVLVTETITTKHRVVATTLVLVSFSCGQVVLANAAWALEGWRVLLMTLYLPSSLFLICWRLLDESPRWLAARGRSKEAADLLFRAAKVNNVIFSAELTQKLTSDPISIEVVNASAPEDNLLLEEIPSTENKASIAYQVIHSKLLMCRLAMCGFWLITCTLIFYGLSINSVSLAGNKYLNFILTSIADIPGYCMSMFAMNRFGRRASLGISFLFCGVSLVSLPLIPKGLHAVVLALSLIGKAWNSMALSCVFIFTSEVFPTQARNTMVSTSSMIGRIGQILAPQTPLLMLIWKPLPYLTFGVFAMLSALLTLLAPETHRVALPDTVQQAERAHRNRNKR